VEVTDEIEKKEEIYKFMNAQQHEQFKEFFGQHEVKYYRIQNFYIYAIYLSILHSNKEEFVERQMILGSGEDTNENIDRTTDPIYLACQTLSCYKLDPSNFEDSSSTQNEEPFLKFSIFKSWLESIKDGWSKRIFLWKVLYFKEYKTHTDRKRLPLFIMPIYDINFN
jgi:hypothetical protein